MFRGSCVALVTPFKNGKVDEETLEKLLKFHIDNGTHAVLAVGTTGESATLDFDEHLKVVEICVSVAKGKIPVIGGSGTNSTEKTIKITKEVKRLKADAALIVAPYYNRPTQDGLYQHYKKVAMEVDIPIIIYNIPGRTGVNISPETIIKLAKECKNIIGVKEASGSLNQVSEIIIGLGDGFSVWSGDDMLTLPMLSVGGKGVISVIANILPKETAELCNTWFNGDVKKAMDLHLKLYPLMQAMFIETNPIPVKAAMSMLGLCSEEVRLPLCAMSSKNKEKLKQILIENKLLKA